MKYRILLIVLVCLFCFFLLLPRNLPGWETPPQLPHSHNRRIQDELKQAAILCLENTDADDIEDALIAAGFPTVDTHGSQPAYLENAQPLRDFCSGLSDHVSVLQVSGETLCHFYFLKGREPLFLSTRITWNGASPIVLEQELLPLYEAELSPWDIFYYRLYPKDDPHYIDYKSLRLTPVDQNLYDLTQLYIEPVGYRMVNLFLTDWEEGNWGELSFNDLFGHLYELTYDSPFPWQNYPLTDLTRISIPAQLFERTILPFFDISQTQLRSLAQYDPETDSYPYRPVHGNDLTAEKYPIQQPQVTHAVSNTDGTLTLTVQVFSDEVKTDNLFTHQVTVRPLENGGFQYVKNQLTHIGSWGLPFSGSRFSLDD